MCYELDLKANNVYQVFCACVLKAMSGHTKSRPDLGRYFRRQLNTVLKTRGILCTPASRLLMPLQAKKNGSDILVVKTAMVFEIHQWDKPFLHHSTVISSPWRIQFEHLLVKQLFL